MILIKSTKYRSQINLAKQYKNLAKECINGFDHSDFVLLVNSLTETIAKLRGVIDDLKEVDADDRVTIYNLLISAIIIKSVEESDLDENTKKQVVDAFKTGGMALNLIELIRESIKKSLQKWIQIKITMLINSNFKNIMRTNLIKIAVALVKNIIKKKQNVLLIVVSHF